MRLYIVRHAIAVARGTAGIKDNDRALTEEGIEKMKRAAAGLFALDYIPNLILSSPLIRAKQTAEILLEAFAGKIPLKIIPALAPTGNRADLYAEIRNHRKLESLMLVGHQPSLGEIAGEIAWGSSENYVEFKKGGVCAIDLESLGGIPQGTIISLLTPSILRKVIA